MKKTELSLKIYGEPILRKQTAPVIKFDSDLVDIFNQMIPIMRANNGVGLAATQAGLDLQLCIVDVGSGVYKFCNPKIIETKGTQIQEEGCLSLPDIMVKVKRADKITLQYQDERGKAHQIECAELFSRAVQHEIDHINGKLIIDYLPWIKKIGLIGKINKIRGKQK